MSSAAASGIGIIGLGKCLPKKLVPNAALAKKIKTSADMIRSRSGIESRHYVSRGETTSSLSAEAAKRAIKSSGVKIRDIGWILGCTSTGDYRFPAMACKVQDLIGACAAAYDISASAVSFPLGITLAADRLHSDKSLKNALVIGAAVQSPFIPWNDPKTAAVLGDGAAAAVISRVPSGYGILASEFISNGKLFDAARLKSGFIEIDGVALGREYLKHQPEILDRCLQKAHINSKDVDLYIFHQANMRLVQLLMAKLRLSMNKTYANADRVGNTAEASIPIALCEAWEQGRIKRGSIVVLSGAGAGTFLGSLVLRWY